MNKSEISHAVGDSLAPEACAVDHSKAVVLVLVTQCFLLTR